jgi:hypothetical protein
LDTAQEKVLLEWIDHSAISGEPFHAGGLRARAKDLSGKQPGRHWHERFKQRHADVLVAAKATGLDPARGKNFNKANVLHLVSLITELIETYGFIPPEHLWNTDEKGVQMGGGRKAGRRLYYYLRKRRYRYRKCSDNLELVTVIEVVNAAGQAAPPYFVLSEGQMPDIRQVPGEIGGFVVINI